MTAFDFGRSAGPLEVRLGDAHYQVERRGANNSKRYWRSDSLANMRLLNRLGGLGNPGVAAIRASRAVWDVSGGDSFTDLYGVKRFWTTTHPKFLAIEAGRPLVLLPQTYGPFQDPGLRKIAEEVTRKAASAWARDERSFEALRELLGSEFDPARHRCGVDMAFGLPTTPPRAGVVPAAVQEWREAGASIVGLNVSGLIYLDPRAAQERYGFRADYGAVMRGLVQALVERDQRVVLVPHVLEPAGNVESDPEACRQLVHDLSPEVRNRVAVLAPPYSAAEVKHVLAGLEWFCGTRMHSTIGSLSSGVPTAAVAYSLKFQGVFETCDQAAGVADPRSLDTAETLAHLVASFEARAARKQALAQALVTVRQQVAEQRAGILKASTL
ncbi:MAG: polysaccharide pyruvyl transferase family protein [Planctomycetota bacterium]